VIPLERTPREIKRNAASCQSSLLRCARVVSADESGNENVLAEAMCALLNRFAAWRRNPFESVALHDAHELLSLPLRSACHIGVYAADIVEIVPAGQESCQFAHRNGEAAADMPRPSYGRTVSRHDRHMLVPEMKLDQAVADSESCSVNQQNIFCVLDNLDAEH